MWRVEQEAGQRLHLDWQAHTDTVLSIDFSPDERTLATGSVDGSVKLWEVTSGSLLWSDWQADNIYGVAFAPDEQTLPSSGGCDCSALGPTQWQAARDPLAACCRLGGPVESRSQDALHGAAHNAFMKLAAYTRTREGELRPLGRGPNPGRALQ